MKQLLFILIFSMFTYISPAAAYNVEQAKEDLKLERYTTAIESLRTLVEQEEDNYEAWFLFGVAHVHEQQYHQAIEAFRQVIALRPDLAEPHNNLAAVYNSLDDTKSAVRELEIALKKRPNYTIAEENLADLYVKLALQHYRNSLKNAPNPLVEQRYARLMKVRNPVFEAKSTPAKDIAIAPTTKPVAQQKPTPAPKTTESQTASNQNPIPVQAKLPQVEKSITGVLDALEAWKAAWSSQNLQAYFAAYAKNYQPDARFASKAAWEAYKTRVIQNKTFIRIGLEQVEVSMANHNKTADIKLLQRFHSNTYNGNDFKKITFKYTPQGWKITHEASIQ